MTEGLSDVVEARKILRAVEIDRLRLLAGWSSRGTKDLRDGAL